MSESSTVLYALTCVALFALPWMGNRALRKALPAWLKVVAFGGFVASPVSLVIAVHPIVNVVSAAAYAGKICGVAAVANMIGVLIYRSGESRG